MKLFTAVSWLVTPANRDIIARRTVGAERGMQHHLSLPAPPDPDRFEFLVLGDTGDSAAAGARTSPQDAVGRFLAEDAALPGSPGRACMVVHTGDVVYMAGERTLYDRNFRRPYQPFLTPESTAQNLIFRVPFLPVPGNHDYYDLGRFGRALARIPFLGAGLRALAHELFSFSLPDSGSEMGRTYMRAFVDTDADTTAMALHYEPGARTRLPNRYYRFRAGCVDFFALDSNTLDAPPPSADAARVRAAAKREIQALEARARTLDRELRREQLALDRWHETQRRRVAADPARLQGLVAAAAAVVEALRRLHEVLQSLIPDCPDAAPALEAAVTAERRWSEGVADLRAGGGVSRETVEALRSLEDAGEEVCTVVGEVEEVLAALAEGLERSRLLAARDETDRAADAWSAASLSEAPPAELCGNIRQLSQTALDVQRELALERTRARFRPEDYDGEQLRWLAAALEESARERPDAWRVLYLHHPLYTTITNHCERSDVRSVRANLLSLVRERVHLILTGHSHAFEWIRSTALPNAGIFVTGGGGQIALRRSVLDPRRIDLHRHRYRDLREAGVVECAVAGRGPAAADGAAGLLYHYLRVEVTPERLVVRPVGVRRAAGDYRREAPMPVYHAAVLPEEQPPWTSRRLEGVEIRRDAPPRARWR